MGMALYLLGIALYLVGFIWVVVNAFKTSALWGLGSLFIPVVALVFAIMNWERNKKPFLIMIAGIVLLIGGGVLMVGSAVSGMPVPTN